MNNLSNLIWIEARKAIRSKMPLWTTLGGLFFPFGVVFLIVVAKNPQLFQKLGLVSAKANLLEFSNIDWPAYLGAFGQIIAVGGFFLFVLIISWIFGHEFSDGTVKDLLAVPIQRSNILLAKFIVGAAWAAAASMVIFIVGLLLGWILNLPGGSPSAILQGSVLVLVTTCLEIVAALPFALFASLGRGYLLPIGIAVLTVLLTNLVIVIGRGEYFPWAVPALYAQAKTPLAPVSYMIAILTSLAGMLATYLWWKNADQNR